MFLHNDKKRFVAVISEAFDATSIPEAMIEKDYFVTMFLKHLAEKEPLLVFKGGMSFEMFQTDQTFLRGYRHKSLRNGTTVAQTQERDKYNIVETIERLELDLSNPEEVRSGRDHNIYKVSYPSMFKSQSLKQHLEVESYFLIGSFPAANMSVTSFIYDHLKERGLDDIVAKYDLGPSKFASRHWNERSSTRYSPCAIIT